MPYFEKIYNMSGYPDFVKKHGTDFSYQLAPRAKIFRRDEGKVVDMPSMKKIMRYNGMFLTNTKFYFDNVGLNCQFLMSKIIYWQLVHLTCIPGYLSNNYQFCHK